VVSAVDLFLHGFENSDVKASSKRCTAACALLLSVATMSSAAGSASPLADAVRAGDEKGVRAQLKQPRQVDAREADGTAPLHWAARADHIVIADLLVGAGADANAVDRYGVTPLMLAATNGSAGMIERLVKAGANVNAAMPEGQTVLMTAARTGRPEALKALIVHGADVNAHETWLGETALMWAAAEDHGDAVKVLLAGGADPNLQSTPTTFKRKVGGQTILPRGGFTALMYAAREGAIDAVRALADSRADLNRGDPDGVTALILSIINAHYDVAALLLERGADPNVADSTGMTPLYAAVDMNTLQFMHGRPSVRPSGRLGAVDLAKLLLNRGADPNAALKSPILQRHNNAPLQTLGEGTTPLMRAAKSGDVELMRVLVDYGADPSLRQKNNNTLLILAAGFGRRFDQNADAQEYEHGTQDDLLQAVKLCVELGLDVNAANDGGETALHVAVSDAIVRYLVDNGAKLEAKNKEGKTPLQVAVSRKDRSGRQLLPEALTALRELNGN
jgi:ankyrin repeat protein